MNFVMTLWDIPRLLLADLHKDLSVGYEFGVLGVSFLSRRELA